MGKRKRGAYEPNTPPSDIMHCLSETELLTNESMPCTSGLDFMEKEKSLCAVGTSSPKPPSSAVDKFDNTTKPSSSNPSPPHQQHNISRSLLLRRSRQYFGHHYSRRNSGKHGAASASHWKSSPSHDKTLTFKLTSQCNLESRCHAESKEKPVYRQDKIRSSSLTTNAISTDVMKMICGLCQKPLRCKLYSFGNSPSSSDVSVVAVLVCGHVYHADCLEQKTSHENRRDPPCPLCSSSAVMVDAFGKQE
ncbi:hypothetical protein RJ641_027094 [Dillenia turbinata]|uniref:RING-type domain-containing protein n=1 Tax=Dillenia turbinata TaxID=194707 RepID=A0AAN8ZLC2_9MAGN